MKLPSWLEQRLSVIPLVYAQQKQMLETNTHACPNRIVSLAQPHVRPIQRGKRPNPTEFGQKLHLSRVDGYTYLEQTSWSNYNEGCDLKATVEDYRRKFGFYPEAVLADKIYVAKRKYGLDLIMSKLDETAKTEAALVILAMNAAHRLRRWLLRFFNFWGLDVVFQ